MLLQQKEELVGWPTKFLRANKGIGSFYFLRNDDQIIKNPAPAYIYMKVGFLNPHQPVAFKKFCSKVTRQKRVRIVGFWTDQFVYSKDLGKTRLFWASKIERIEDSHGGNIFHRMRPSLSTSSR